MSIDQGKKKKRKFSKVESGINERAEYGIKETYLIT